MNTICRSPVDDAASVYMIALSWSSVRSCASSNTTICISSKPRLPARERAENSTLAPFERCIASSPLVYLMLTTKDDSSGCRLSVK